MSALNSILITIALFFASLSLSATKQTVNPILGDVSYVQKFGHTPNENANEQIRIQTHLQFVESILRLRDVSKMPKALRENRNKMLNLMHDYWMRGEFPVNYDHPGTRIPCFIDKDSRICAVGYLIEKTAGRDVAEKINADFKYAEIFEMKNPLVENWIASSGLTKMECAMIQPTYEYRNYQEPIDPYISTSPPVQNFPEPIDPYIVTLPPLQVDATRNDRAVKKRMDSLITLTYVQNLKLDSLHSELNLLNHSLDSAENLNQQKDQEIEKIKNDSLHSQNFLTTVIWILSIISGAAAFLLTIKLLNSKKA